MPETVHNTAVHVEGLRFRSLPEDTRGARAPASGFILAGTLFVPAGADYKKSAPLPGLVVGHGAGSNRNRHEEFCRTACGKGMAVMALDMRGHGESGGEADGPLHRDIVAAVEVLRSHPLVDPNRIGYRGSSMGGYYGLAAALSARFAAMALLCPANERILIHALNNPPPAEELLARGLEARFNVQKFRSYLQNMEILDEAADIDTPTLLVHARQDTVVPLRVTLELAERLGGDTEVFILNGGDHSTAQSDPLIHQRVSGWLIERLLGDARA